MAANRDLAALSALFNRCKDWKKFEGENPVRSVKKLKEPLNRVRFLSAEEETALLNKCKEPLRTIVLLGIYAELRISAEALTLKKENVDLSTLIGPLTERLDHAVGESVFERPNGKCVVSI